jgi:cob(I)alamin adenosyltransferase
MRPIKKHNNSGRLHVYTGDGKGKTTAALGLAMRALGRGWRVLIVKYLKPKHLTSGEDLVIRNISDSIDEMKINCCGVIGRYRKKTEQAICRECEESLALIEQQWWKYNLVILDEINVVLHLGLLDLEKFMFFLSRRPARLELVLTGRYAPKELLKIADYVTDMRPVKHPYEKGVKARKGIEF